MGLPGWRNITGWILVYIYNDNDDINDDYDEDDGI